MSGQTVAYIRVSSVDQNLDRQRVICQGVDRVFEEKASAGTRNRPVLEEMLNYLREGDTLKVHSMDRLSRSMRDLFNILDELNKKGVRVQFVKEGLSFSSWEDASPMEKFMLTVLAAFSEMERSVIKERQREGIERAKKEGKYKGRKRVLTDEQAIYVAGQVKLGVPKARLAREFKTSATTINRELKRLENKNREAE
ncbi:recombinase family protein [Cutibacterium avidum]|uniref:recombinase family protein n=1 Tax=Cutibacterium avidum TaxID=33010 RepID=UPI002FF1BE97|nr:recombinase family protein [Streptococcus salivarius]